MSENEILRTLPILPLRGMVVFPYMMVHLDAGRDPSISALEKAMLQEEHHVFCWHSGMQMWRDLR